jgi:O-antigen ligase
MTIRLGNRSAPSQIASVAMGEMRLAGRAVPNLLRHLAPIVAWTVASIALGVVLGLSAVMLPPMGSFGIVAVAGLVLLWVMPDLPLVSPGLIRGTFFVMLVADLCIPYYYTVQFSGLPWISARRLATFSLIVPFLLAVAASHEVRRQIVERVRASLLILICAIGFLSMVVMSVATSVAPTDSASSLIDLILSCYLPFFAMIYIIKDKGDIVFILKIISACAIFVTAGGVVNFVLQEDVFLRLIPPSMLDTLVANNPTLQYLLPSLHFAHWRHGLYRSQSIFVTPLSFGEFEIIVFPIGLFLALHRNNLFEKMLGWAVVVGGPIGIYSSGDRAPWLGVIVTLSLFIAIWSIRRAIKNKASLAPAIGVLTGLIFLFCFVSLIAFSHRFHDMVLGGATEANSTQARYDQWAAGVPSIMSNPITGHGFGMGGAVIHGDTIDSYILSLVLETGVPGFLFFAGLLILPIWYGLRNYILDMTEHGAVAGALACSFLAFTLNRLVLSQKENHTLIFSLLAIVVAVNYEYAGRRVQQPSDDKPPRSAYYPKGSIAVGRR